MFESGKGLIKAISEDYQTTATRKRNLIETKPSSTATTTMKNMINSRHMMKYGAPTIKGHSFMVDKTKERSLFIENIIIRYRKKNGNSLLPFKCIDHIAWIMIIVGVIFNLLYITQVTSMTTSAQTSNGQQEQQVINNLPTVIVRGFLVSLDKNREFDYHLIPSLI